MFVKLHIQEMQHGIMSVDLDREIMGWNYPKFASNQLRKIWTCWHTVLLTWIILPSFMITMSWIYDFLSMADSVWPTDPIQTKKTPSTLTSCAIPFWQVESITAWCLCHIWFCPLKGNMTHATMLSFLCHLWFECIWSQPQMWRCRQWSVASKIILIDWHTHKIMYRLTCIPITWSYTNYENIYLIREKYNTSSICTANYVKNYLTSHCKIVTMLLWFCIDKVP